VTDKDNTIYWTSAKSRRHSKEIKNNSRVAATIVHDSLNKQALQITGLAHEAEILA
jgi:general stress protein 26